VVVSGLREVAIVVIVVCVVVAVDLAPKHDAHHFVLSVFSGVDRALRKEMLGKLPAVV
jgi:hypothetical protein